MRSHVQVIEAFGGTAPLARAIGLHGQLACHWARRGIPAKYWPLIAETETARRLGITAIMLTRLPITADLEAA